MRSSTGASSDRLLQGNYDLSFQNCAACCVGSKNKEAAAQHLEIRRDSNELFCKLCSRPFDRQEHLVHHVQAVHFVEIPKACRFCMRKFHCLLGLINHLLIHAGVEACCVCLKTFPDKTLLDDHVKSHKLKKKSSHSQKMSVDLSPGVKYPAVCDICPKGFLTEASLNNHKMCHHYYKKVPACKICPKLFGSLHDLRDHLQRVHVSPEDLTCNICQICFTSETKLASHREVHCSDKQYPASDVNSENNCENVPGEFDRKNLIHKKSFRCHICFMSFNKKNGLLHHLLLHAETEKKTYECELCCKTYHSKGGLNVHRRRMHLPTAEFSCNLCHKSFSNQMYLKRHERSHSGEKPHRCDFCLKCFTRSCNLRTHLRSHTGEKPYSCELCPKSFSHNVSLKSHVLVHSKEPVCCNVCSEPCLGKRELKRHLKNHAYTGGNDQRKV